MTLKRKTVGDFKYFYLSEGLSVASILVAVFSRWATRVLKEGELCLEMQIKKSKTNIPKYLLITDENNNYSDNNTWSKPGRSSDIEKISVNCNR